MSIREQLYRGIPIDVAAEMTIPVSIMTPEFFDRVSVPAAAAALSVTVDDLKPVAHREQARAEENLETAELALEAAQREVVRARAHVIALEQLGEFLSQEARK